MSAPSSTGQILGSVSKSGQTWSFILDTQGSGQALYVYNSVSTNTNGYLGFFGPDGSWNVGNSSYGPNGISSTGATITSSGITVNGTGVFNAGNSSEVPVTINGAVGQAVDLFDVYLSSGGTKVFWLDSAGTAHVNSLLNVNGGTFDGHTLTSTSGGAGNLQLDSSTGATTVNINYNSSGTGGLYVYDGGTVNYLRLNPGGITANQTFLYLNGSNGTNGGVALNNSGNTNAIAYFQSQGTTKSYIYGDGSLRAGSSIYGPTSAAVAGVISTTNGLGYTGQSSATAAGTLYFGPPSWSNGAGNDLFGIYHTGGANQIFTFAGSGSPYLSVGMDGGLNVGSNTDPGAGNITASGAMALNGAASSITIGTPGVANAGAIFIANAQTLNGKKTQLGTGTNAVNTIQNTLLGIADANRSWLVTWDQGGNMGLVGGIVSASLSAPSGNNLFLNAGGAGSGVDVQYNSGSNVGLYVYDGGTTNRAQITVGSGLTVGSSAYGPTSATVNGTVTANGGVVGDISVGGSWQILAPSGRNVIINGSNATFGAVNINYNSGSTGALSGAGLRVFDGGTTTYSTYGPTGATLAGGIVLTNGGSLTMGSSVYGPTSAAVNGNVTILGFASAGGNNTLGSAQYSTLGPILQSKGMTSNGDTLNTTLYRAASGTNWTTASWRIWRNVDATPMQFIDFTGQLPTSSIVFGYGGVNGGTNWLTVTNGNVTAGSGWLYLNANNSAAGGTVALNYNAGANQTGGLRVYDGGNSTYAQLLPNALTFSGGSSSYGMSGATISGTLTLPALGTATSAQSYNSSSVAFDNSTWNGPASAAQTNSWSMLMGTNNALYFRYNGTNTFYHSSDGTLTVGASTTSSFGPANTVISGTLSVAGGKFSVDLNGQPNTTWAYKLTGTNAWQITLDGSDNLQFRYNSSNVAIFSTTGAPTFSGTVVAPQFNISGNANGQPFISLDNGTITSPGINFCLPNAAPSYGFRFFTNGTTTRLVQFTESSAIFSTAVIVQAGITLYGTGNTFTGTDFYFGSQSTTAGTIHFRTNGYSNADTLTVNSSGTITIGSSTYGATGATLNGMLVANGAQINVVGSGGTANTLELHDTTTNSVNPNKYLRVNGGALQICNSAFTAVPWQVDDSGNVTQSGNLSFSSGGTQGIYWNNSGQAISDDGSGSHGFNISTSSASTLGFRFFVGVPSGSTQVAQIANNGAFVGNSSGFGGTGAAIIQANGANGNVYLAPSGMNGNAFYFSSSGLYLTPNHTATSTNNYSSTSLVLQNSVWNGSAAITNSASIGLDTTNNITFYYGGTDEMWLDGAGSGLYLTNGWLRTYGNTGWYNQTYAGGWYMTDSTWVRTYNSRPVFIGGTTLYGGAGSAHAYGALTIQGDKSGWGGVNFVDAAGNNLGTLMFANPTGNASGYWGIYNKADNAWVWQLDASGNNTVAGAYYANSLSSLKRSIRPISFDSLEVIKRTDVVHFNYHTDDEGHAARLGILAEHAPEELTAEERTKHDLNASIAILLDAVKRLTLRVEELEAR